MPEPILQISYSLATLENNLDQFWQSVHQYRVLAFHGDMGAGKTTFISALCSFLGVEDSVSSPTFALVNEYHFPEHGKDTLIYHMDWYRLRDAAEAISSGIEDTLRSPDAYCFIEWPEKAPEILPRPYVRIDIRVTGEQERMLTCQIIN